ncbi:MAG: hypothetical protein AAGA58_03470 [Verrucomicrobiota bacterium]
MPRKLKLTERQGLILRLLEEAGAESQNTIVASFGSQDMEAFHADLAFLLNEGLINCSTDEENSEIAISEEGLRILKL